MSRQFRNFTVDGRWAASLPSVATARRLRELGYETPADYEQDVLRILRQLAQDRTGIGRWVMEEVVDYCMILPYLPRGTRQRNAFADLHSIQFSPNHYRRPFDTAGKNPDTVLVHEIAHVGRRQAGIPAGPSLPGYSHEDEFYAVLVGNYYCQAYGRAMRLDHDGYGTLTIDDQTWLNQPLGQGTHRTYVERFIQQQDRLAKRLSGLSNRFNPVAIVMGVRRSP